MKLWQIVVQELRVLFFHKSPAILLLVGVPVLFSLLFGVAYSVNIVKNIPTVIYDQDQTVTSRALVQAYADSERYEIVAQVTTQEAMEQYLRDNVALVSVAIPPKFAQNIKLGVASEVLVETNSLNLMFANAVISTSQEIIQTFSAGVGQKLFEAANQMPAQALRTAAPIRLGVRIINNPTTSYSNFMLPGLGANGLQLGIIIAICTVLTREYANLSRWRNTASSILVLGKLLPYWLAAILAFLLYIAILVGCFNVPCRGDLGSLLLIGSAYTFAVANVGLFFSAITDNEVVAIQAPILYIMPAFLFSGYSWPQFAITGFSHYFSAMLPLSYAATNIRDVLLAGYAPDLVKDSFTLFAAGSVLCILSIILFTKHRKKLENCSKEALV